MNFGHLLATQIVRNNIKKAVMCKVRRVERWVRMSEDSEAPLPNTKGAVEKGKC